jgi:hypothetical protein
MGEAIGQLPPFAVGVAVSPMPIVAVVLMLVTPRARSNGPAFLLATSSKPLPWCWVVD